MKVKDFIEILSQAPQDAEIFCEDFYSSFSPLGSIWLYKKYNRLIVSQYDHFTHDTQPALYLNPNFKSLHDEKSSSIL